MALTKREIDALAWDPAGPSQQVAWDDKLTGLGVRVYESGIKSFVLFYRTRSGRKRLATLGRFGVLTLDQARAKARKWLVEVGEGLDPVEERRREERAVSTFRELADRWLEEHAKPKLRSWPEAKRRLDKHVLPRLGRIPVEDVQSADVRALHAAIGKKAPIEANRVLALIRGIYNTGSKWELLPPGIPNPADAVDPFEETSRETYLTAAELNRLAKALDAEEDIYAVAAIRLLLLTGCRKRELLRARWDRLDLDGRRLQIPGKDTKTGKPKIVPLSRPALAIVKDLPRMLHSPWIFPSPRDSKKPRGDIRSAWERVRKAARIQNTTIHDLRRTAGSWLVQRGVPLRVIGEVLGHRDARSTEVYARIAADQPREALELLGEAFGSVVRAEES